MLENSLKRPNSAMEKDTNTISNNTPIDKHLQASSK